MNRSVLLDPREGSKDLAPFLRSLSLPVELTRLEFGDVAFDGHGPHGEVHIGIEYKTLRDFLTSMRTGRLPGHQLPGMIKSYHVSYIIIEGPWRESPTSGIVETPRRGGWQELCCGTARFMASELVGYALTLESKGGARVWWTRDKDETAQMVRQIWRWWGKGWDEHSSLKVVYQAPLGVVQFTEPSLVRKVANCLPGIGWEKSGAVEARFKSVLDMVCGRVQDWERVPGVGKVLANRIVKLLGGEE